MFLGDRLRACREGRQRSIREVAERCGLSANFIQRVECGHDVPNIEELEIWAAALGVPVHQLFYDGEFPPPLVNLPNRLTENDVVQVKLLGKMNGLQSKHP